MVARLSLGLLACLFAFARPGLAQPARAALISDVKHAPPSPGPDTDVVVTARVASGATKVALKVQAVAPGKYIRKADAEYVGRMRGLGITHYRIDLLRETPEQVGSLLTQYARVIAGLDDGRETWRQLRALNQLGVTRGTLQLV